MNGAIKKIFIFLLLFSALNAWAEEQPQQIDMSVTVKTLAEAAVSGVNIPPVGTAVVLNGTVLERAVVNSEKETFAAEILLGSGEWTSSNDVQISKCIVLLNGPEYAEMIPARRSRQTNPLEIPVNSELLVYGVLLGFADTAEGPIAVIQSGGIRKL